MTKEESIEVLEGQVAILRTDKLEAMAKLDACQLGVCDEKKSLIDEQDKLELGSEEWQKIEEKIKQLEQKRENDFTRISNTINRKIIAIDVLKNEVE